MWRDLSSLSDIVDNGMMEMLVNGDGDGRFDDGGDVEGRRVGPVLVGEVTSSLPRQGYTTNPQKMLSLFSYKLCNYM